ncbi:hypothetical protein V6N11_052454 [Hibiscus sabdariffa]|uniref:Reverse transcriptase zinc-binding domain-containing protein n=1 Tax=Hibiscus sabdariffa TaxID=183260 RepID=A0ABR2UAM2_9ROSI
MVDELGRWKWCLLEHVLPYEILLRLAAIKPLFGNSYDQRGWLPSLDKKFSVRSAFDIRNRIMCDPFELIWKAIAAFRGIPRVKTFLWLVCHGKVLTNDERGRRHLTIDRGCHVCGVGSENIDHILRWCPLAFLLWNSLNSATSYGSFTLIPHIVELLTRPWTISVSLVVREGNVLTDNITKMEVDEIFMCYRFCLPPDCCLDRLRLEAAMVRPGSWPS